MALAFISLLAALGLAVGRVAPESVAGLWPENGLTIARAANMQLAAGMSVEAEGLPTDVSEETIRISQSALRREPLAVSALRNLGYGASASGDPMQAAQIMKIGSKLSRREAGINIWLIDHYEKQGNLGRTFKHFDYLLRTNSRASGTMLPLMAQALPATGAVEAFAELLASGPPWSANFWTAVIENGTVAVPAASLRKTLYSKGVELTPHHDEFLLTQLTRQGALDEAWTLYQAASQPLSSVRTGVLSDPSFDREPLLAPFDWEIIQAEEFGSRLDTERGHLHVNSLPGGEGVFLQQLLRLEAGAYRISVETKKDGGALGERALDVRIACAELAGAATFDDKIGLLPNGASEFEISGPCRFFWFSLELDASKGASGLNFQIDEVRLVKA
ncbi:hypothetical protein [Altererythrobacter sp. MF3-039]|uniref:hypothetical protein n=1 Tax=Altererythrobacter sp. MF3-039 TaxID=3252901 RepID=UPI00390C8080